MSADKLDGRVDSEVWNSKPRRLSEIWKIDRETSTVYALGLLGVVQLNGVGSAIWLRLDGEHTIASIAQGLIAAYPSEDQSQIEIDITSFINHLIADSLITLDWRPLYSRVSPECLEGAP